MSSISSNSKRKEKLREASRSDVLTNAQGNYSTNSSNEAERYRESEKAYFSRDILRANQSKKRGKKQGGERDAKNKVGW